jgi:hypothetical protein
MTLRHSKRLAGTVSVAAALLLLVSTTTAQQQSPWTRAAFEKLFPAPPAGWSLSQLQVEETKTIASAFEGMANMAAAISGKQAPGESVRYKLTREYRSSARVIRAAIDSEDIMADGLVHTLHGYQIDKDGKQVPLSADFKAMRDKLMGEGLQPVKFGDHVGVRGTQGSESGLAVLIGTRGTWTLECSYANCAADLDVLMKTADLKRLDEFARFRHVKPK